MSLRPYPEQLKAEEAAEAAFYRGLGSAAPHFDAMTLDEVVATSPCLLHRKAKGVFCGCHRGVFFNCIGRRSAAARVKAASE